MLRAQERPLAGKVVFITGAARGIGYATALALVGEGSKVAIADVDGDLAARAARELGADVLALTLDVTDHAAFTAAFQSVERRLGPIDVLVNNAGVMPVGPFESDSHDAAFRVFGVNFFAVLHGTREAMNRMRPRGHGHIVNIASLASVIPLPGAAVYSASKHAILGFCESLAWELRGTGVDLSYVMPALVNTELTVGLKKSRASGAIEPEDVAAAVVNVLKRPRLAVYVPRSMAYASKFRGLLPRRLSDKTMIISGADRVLLDSTQDPGRIAYELRVAASTPSLDAPPQGTSIEPRANA